MKRLWIIVIFCAWLSAGAVRAEDKGESIYIDMHGSLVNQYFFRGMRQGSKGVVMQGDANLRVALYDEDDFKFQVFGGGFLSFHPKDERNGEGLSASLLEQQGWLGLGVLTPLLEVNGLVSAYISPNDSFEDVVELDLIGRFRDEALWTGGDDEAVFRGFFPAFTLAQEVSGERDGQDKGTYLELAMAPRLRLLYGALLGIDLVFPATLGLSLRDYYQFRAQPSDRLQNAVFGFAAVGVLLDFESRLLPDRLGGWHFRPRMDVLFPKAQEDADVPFVDTAEFIVRSELAWDF